MRVAIVDPDSGQLYKKDMWTKQVQVELENFWLVNHTGVSLRFTTQRSLNKSCDIPILEAAVRQVTPSL